MSELSNEADIKRRASTEFLADCSDDDWAEELWKLVWIIKYIINDDDYPTGDADVSDPALVRRIAINVIDELLRSGQLQAWFTNYPITDTYSRELAKTPVDEVLGRINSEWDALGREPSMCEIVAFSVRPAKAANKAVNPSGGSGGF